MIIWIVLLAVIIAAVIGFCVYINTEKTIYEVIAGSVAFVAMLIICYAASWIITCGVVKLITMCFGWAFKWSVATGIWLIAGLIKWLFFRKDKK